MSRARRGGGRKRGPDLSWEDEEETPATPPSNKPEELFPNITLPVPRPISPSELSSVTHYLGFRTRARNGPYYSILDPSSVAEKETGKVLKRAGFDPFNDQEKYTAKYHRKKRAVPDLSTRQYALHTFPHELWPLLDPDRKHPLWKSSDIDIDASTNAPKSKPLKRKREQAGEPTGASLDNEEDHEARASDNDDSDDELISGARRRARNAAKAAAKKKRRQESQKSREKRGLDAEDEFSDHEDEEEARQLRRAKRRKKANDAGGESDDEDDEDDDNNNQRQRGRDDENGSDDDDDDNDDEDDDEPVDSEFEESDDGGADDYNAENYFDTGEGDDDDGGFAFGAGGGGDEGGEYF